MRRCLSNIVRGAQLQSAITITAHSPDRAAISCGFHAADAGARDEDIALSVAAVG
jgi:hypothetical protein